ncbi:family S53 protease-like protein [Mycena sanguinolenta]|nr:family S53 protease-like protein [Mycena sanguinolenta]
MVIKTTFIVSLCLAASAKSFVQRAMAVHETREKPPSGFVDSGLAPATTNLTLRIAMKPNNISGLVTQLYGVSDPASELYGQHLTAEEVASFVKPTAETSSNVSAWLSENAITSTPVSPAGDIIEFTISVAEANNLLSTQFSIFNYVETGKTSIRTLEYSIPAELQQHIDFVHPTTSFTRPIASPKFHAIKAVRQMPSPAVAPRPDVVPASCAETITPACLQAIYGIPTTPATQPANKLGVSGFSDDFANQADLTQFLTKFRPDLSPATTFTLQTLDGGTNPQTRDEAGIEANLDIQYTVGLASKVPVTFISVGEDNRDGLDGFMDILTALIAEPSRPTVLTTSDGFDESDLSRPVATTLCNTYAQLGALGLNTNNPGGVSGTQSQACTTFIPTLPAGCPFVTSVGATTGISETAAPFSSGGFSNYFPIPSYQTEDVVTYLAALGASNAGKFNRTGRGFPDVAAQGENFEIVFGAVSSTSCASPTFASIVALLNDQLIGAGKAPLGFLNPLLYSAAGRAALNDITIGSNPGCNTNGFPALKGWDGVTGLGTPDYTHSTDPASANDTLVPDSDMDGQINALFSFLTMESDDEAIFVFRCQNCSVLTNYLAEAPQVTITTVIAPSDPEYINGTGFANLSLADAQYESFTVDTTQARFANYSSMLKAAGFTP